MTTYHIRDRETGQFYGGTDFIPSATDPKVVPKYAKKGLGKVFLDLGKIKVHINYLIGLAMPPKWFEQKQAQRWKMRYGSAEYAALSAELEAWELLHPGYSNVPEFLENRYRWETIPESWEVVAVHNKEKGEQEVVDFSPSEYAALNQRLRRLTDTFGPAVKDVFKKIETKGKLEEFRWVAVVAPDLSMLRDSKTQWWQSIDAFRPDATQIDGIIKQMGTKRADHVRATKEFCVAVAFRTMPEAVMFRLGYAGELKARILDMAKMEQVVDEPQ